MNESDLVTPEPGVDRSPGDMSAPGTYESGLVLRPVMPEAALTLLAELDDFDANEQAETFEYLKKALNQSRAARGERLIFPDEQVDFT
jgi:hypothetical protein